jgi:glycerol-3-phosphate O-acyltransferase
VRTWYLLDENDDVDHTILVDWLRQNAAADAEVIVLGVGQLAGELAGATDDVELAPLRVAWLAPERDGDRTVRIRDLRYGDPRHPNRRRKRHIAQRTPERVSVVAAAPALLSAVRARPGAPRRPDPVELARFVELQAKLAIERAEYRLRGAQYKVPRLVREDLLGSSAFRARADQLAAELGRDADEVWSEVITCVDEMVTGYSRLFLDLMARLGKRVKRPGYGDEIDYDPEQLVRVRDTLARYPAIILPSHKSNLDATVIPVVLHENGLPPTHTFAGINMAFWPFGAIFRRAGRIFIRRDIKDDPVYRWVLREYLAYLVEKRFNLEWYVEGTRSRTGKLAPPKMGLLRYVVDACRDGRTDDVMLMPVSIIYDQLDEVREFASEATGSAKKAETLGWALKFIRAQRGEFGKIYVRFGEPISLRSVVGPVVPAPSADQTPDDAGDLELQKLAFEVCTRINDVTAITGSALVCLMLLATRGRALSSSELHAGVQHLLDQAEARRLPLAASAQRLRTEDGVRAIVATLSANGTVEVFDEGDRPVYLVERGHHLAAAFYRNTIVHYFVNNSIAEVSLLAAAESDVADTGGDRVEAFWASALALRDLLKFDFFFEPRDGFQRSLRSDLDTRLPGWEDMLRGGADPGSVLDKLQPLQAFAVLRPFIEAYLIVAKVLQDTPADKPLDRKAFTKRCLAQGGQWLRQDRLRSPEAVSKYLFDPAIKLAQHRRLATPAPDLAAGRKALLDELAGIARRIDVLEQRTYDAAGRSLTETSW